MEDDNYYGSNSTTEYGSYSTTEYGWYSTTEYDPYASNCDPNQYYYDSSAYGYDPSQYEYEYGPPHQPGVPAFDSSVPPPNFPPPPTLPVDVTRPPPPFAQTMADLAAHMTGYSTPKRTSPEDEYSRGKERTYDRHGHARYASRDRISSGKRSHDRARSSRSHRSPTNSTSVSYDRRRSYRSEDNHRRWSRSARELRSPHRDRPKRPDDRWSIKNFSSDESNNRESKKELNDLQDDFEKNNDFCDDDSDDKDEPLVKRWYRSSPAELYYTPVEGKQGVVESTARGRKLASLFNEKLIERGKKARPPPGAEPLQPPRTHKPKLCKHKSEHVSSSESSAGSDNDEDDHAMQELERKQNHPRRLHPEMWYNDPGEMNDGPLCRCSARTKRQGIRHGVYTAEKIPEPCNIYSNNADKLYHYRITISPPTNFLIKTLTVIMHDAHEFLFSGFSLLSHHPLTELPTCKVIRFNIAYTIMYVEEQAPVNYTIEELNLFEEFLFTEILELVDLDMGKRTETSCSQFHLFPRWERALDGGGGEVLAMAEVLRYLIRAGNLLLPPSSIPTLRAASENKWSAFVDGVRGMIVTHPGKKPCSVRVDQLDRSLSDEDIINYKDKSTDSIYPEIVHFGIRPPQLSYAGNPEYKKAWRDYVKFRHLVANMAKPSYEEKRQLESKEARLQDMRTQSKMKRDVTIALSAEGFYRTGIMCDVVQHAMLIPVLISHLRFHSSLNHLEKIIGYKFQNRSLLQLALTHPSYRDNFGTNPDHARNSLTNCGIRQPEYGDRKIHYMNIRKRGINTLINIMSRFGKKKETESAISHNERLEFLGDAVVEFVSSIHLFRMFPSLEEGGLATYRAAIVQNQHLAILAKKLGLEQYMLYAHGSDLCHDLELRHAMANCFEALMGALFLDGGIDVADRVFTIALWQDKPIHFQVWNRLRLHLLQEQEPNGDRQWIEHFPFLQELTIFEKSIGIYFTHIRLLARAFTDRSMGFTNLTLGSNQRLEFLGDTVLQLISSEYLYKHFPEHHEGHLSLLRSSLVNNKTQAVVCDDLAMANYTVFHNPKSELKTKDKADLLEAFIGALYIDKNIEYCQAFCDVCLFPRLREFIMYQEWNDPKSKLQQCCLTLRRMDGAEPDIPIYKVIECVGPTNTREYTVAVYFRGERLASARGHCIQEAEMNAAKQALTNSHNLFPQLDRQKRVIAKSMKCQRNTGRGGKYSSVGESSKTRKDKSSYSNRSDYDEKDRRRSSPSCLKSKSSNRTIFKDKDKLPMAYRPDRHNFDDSDEQSSLGNASPPSEKPIDKDDSLEDIESGEASSD